MIEIISNERVLRIHHKDEYVDLRYSVWTVLSSKSTEEIFGPTNEFLATLSEDKRQNIFDAYKEAAEIFSEVNPIEYVKERMMELSAKAVKDICPNELREWALQNANFYVDPPPLETAAKAPPAMTYSPDELFDLRCLCVATKVLTPMIGRYIESLKDTVTNILKEKRATEIYLSTRLVDFPGHIRFNDYVTTLAYRRQRSVPMALRFGQSSTDLDKYLMGLSVVRRFTISRLRSGDDGSIIAYIYTFLEEKIKALGKEPWREKFGTSSSGDSNEVDGYAEQYRIPEEIEADLIVNSNKYLTDLRLIARDLGFGQEEFNKYQEYYNLLINNREKFIVTEPIHLSLVALALCEIIEYPIVEKISEAALKSAIAATVVIYEREGAFDVCQLLMSLRAEKDPTQLTMSLHSNRQVRRLTRTLEVELGRCYPYVPQNQINANTNPGKLAIDNVVKALLAYDWIPTAFSEVETLNDIRLSIAQLIINRVSEEDKITE